jgi:hypothetical protein
MFFVSRFCTSLCLVLSLTLIQISAFAESLALQNDFDKRLELITSIELYGNSLLNISNEKLELDEAAKKVETILTKIKAIGLESKDIFVRNYGLRKFLRLKKNLKLMEENFDEAYLLLSKNYLYECNTFSSCSQAISNLADLTDISPKFVVEILKNKVLPNLETITERESVAVKSTVIYKDSILQRLLSYQAKSLLMLSNYYLLSKNNMLEARVNKLKPSSLKIFNDELENLRQEFYDILGLELDASTETASAEDIISASEEIKEYIARDIKDLDSTQEVHLDEYFNSLHMTNIQNESLGFFVKKNNKVDFELFSKEVIKSLDDHSLSPEVLIFTALRFQAIESKLPHRRDWIVILEKALEKIGSEQRETFNNYVTIYRQIVQMEEEQIEEKLKSLEIPLMSFGGDSLQNNLLKKEKTLAKKYPLFQSLPYQFLKLEGAINRFGMKIAQYQAIEKDKSKKKELSDYQNELMASHDDYIQNWLSLVCHGTDEIAFSKAEKKIKIEFKKSQIGAFNLFSICHKKATNDKLSPYEIRSSDYVTEERIDRIWAPFYLEMGLQIIMLPVTVFSGGMAGAATKVVSTGAIKLGTSIAIKLSLEGMKKALVTKLGPKIISCIAGSIVFTALQRSILSAITLGKVPLYEKNKNLWENYGEELLFGSAIFFFLPYTAALAQNFSKYTLTKNPGFSSFQVGLTNVAIHAGMDTAVFTTIPYIERSIKKLLLKSEDPIIRGWDDFLHNLGHSAMISLAFRVKIASGKH